MAPLARLYHRLLCRAGHHAWRPVARGPGAQRPRAVDLICGRCLTLREAPAADWAR